jgi:cyanophycinase
MRNLILVGMVFFLSATLLFAGGKGGHLFIIGGGERGPQLMRSFLDLAGGPDSARIAIFPMASSSPETTGMELVAEFKGLGAKNVFSFLINREQALSSSTAERLGGITGAYFSGGDQSKQMEVLLNTPVHQKLNELYRNGAVMGGTSAGAAVMSEVMITGDERRNRDSTNPFTSIRAENVVTTTGLGFLRTVVVDQHFIKRKRLNRLFSVVLENPTLLGIGIDESTAIIVSPDSSFKVTGNGTVMVIDASRASSVRTDKRDNLAAANLLTHILMAGDAYNMRTRVVTSGRGKE